MAGRATGIEKLLSEPAPGPCAAPPCPEGEDPTVHELIYSFMLWECGAPRADKAIATLADEFVDYNDLRIALPSELAETLPKRLPRLQERCDRLLECLAHLFELHGSLSIGAVREMPKRQARSAIDGLRGITPFVAARVSLLSLGAHAFPIDARLASTIENAGVDLDSKDPAEIASSLERTFRAGLAEAAYHALESIDAAPAPKRSRTTKKTKSKAKTRSA